MKKIMGKVISVIFLAMFIGVVFVSFDQMNVKFENQVINVINNFQYNIDNEIATDGNIINKARPYSVKVSDVSKILDGTYSGGEKIIFLTFDDGPSENTLKILNILDSENVHATFFVLGNNLNKPLANKAMLETIYRGNAIGNHTFSHNYRVLYPKNSVSNETFFNEIDMTNQKLKDVLGNDFSTNLIRMPGGYMSRKYYNDRNLAAFDEILLKKGLVQVDWNSENGDGIETDVSVGGMVQRVQNQTVHNNHVVLLMHDSGCKNTTIEALPKIIKYFKMQGYSFKVIANDNI